MSVNYRTRGFVFKKEDRLESDRVFTVFTHDFGKVEVFAKAIRKIASKLKGGIEIFSLSEIEFIQGKNRKTLIDAILIEKFNNIIEVPEKIEIINKISGMLDSFIKGQEPDENIWNLIIDFSEKLNNTKLSVNNQPLVYYYFIWNFISVLGYEPELSKCAVCSQKLNPYNLYFSNKEGGVICGLCFQSNKNAKKINSDMIKTLRLILKKDWQTLCKLKIDLYSQKLLKEISEDYYHYLMHTLN